MEKSEIVLRQTQILQSVALKCLEEAEQWNKRAKFALETQEGESHLVVEAVLWAHQYEEDESGDSRFSKSLRAAKDLFKEDLGIDYGGNPELQK